MDDLISRQKAIDALENIDCSDGIGISALKCDVVEDAINAINALPSAQSERKMSNNEWIDFLVSQFDVSRTSAKEMLHGMMRWKKEDNFKKQFNGRRQG